MEAFTGDLWNDLWINWKFMSNFSAHWDVGSINCEVLKQGLFLSIETYAGESVNTKTRNIGKCCNATD